MTNKKEFLIPLSGGVFASRKKHIIFCESDKAYSLNCMVETVDRDLWSVSIGDWNDFDICDWNVLCGKSVYLWPDKQKDGETKNYARLQRVSKKLMSLSPRPKIYWINPDDLEIKEGGDLEDFIEVYSPNDKIVIEQIHSVLANSYSSEPSGKVKKRIEDAISGKRETIRLPWDDIDKATMAIAPGTVTLICGEGGTAKSLFLTQLCEFWHSKLKRAVALFELEEDREYHLMRILAQKTGEPGITNDRWIKENPDIARALYKAHEGLLDEMGKIISEAPVESVTLTYLAKWVDEQARSGKRIICIDPVTAVASGGDIWVEDLKFMMAAKQSIVETGASLVLVTHPKKGGGSIAGMDSLSGGACWARFSQTILWLKNLGDKKECDVLVNGCQMTVEANRMLAVLKARNSFGGGSNYAMNLHGLVLEECGEMLKLKKGE